MKQRSLYVGFDAGASVLATLPACILPAGDWLVSRSLSSASCKVVPVCIEQPRQNWNGQGEPDCLIET